MSGRVGAMQAALASLMNVKPIAVLKDGVLNMTDKVRTRKGLDRPHHRHGGAGFWPRRPCTWGWCKPMTCRQGEALLEQARAALQCGGRAGPDGSVHFRGRKPRTRNGRFGVVSSRVIWQLPASGRRIQDQEARRNGCEDADMG